MPVETFRWDQRIYNVSSILRDVAFGTLKPHSIVWPAEVVKAYFELFLNPCNSDSRPPLHIDLDYADKLPLERLKVPILLVHVYERGLVAYEENNDEPHHVVADGNHRIAKAAAHRLCLTAFIMSRSESERYENFLE